MKGYQLRKIFALLFVLLWSVAGLANQFAGFYPPVDYKAGYIPELVLVADFNRDGKLDILSVNVFSLGLLLGNGDGTFPPPLTTHTGQYIYGAVVADMNEDGIPDVVVSVSAPPVSGLEVLLGNGDGTFQPPIRHSLSLAPFSLVAADFNADGHIDIASLDIVTGAMSTLRVFLGAGNGKLRQISTLKLFYKSVSISGGEFDGDGTPDLAVVSQVNSHTITILLGNGDGTFRRGDTYPTVVEGASAISAADVNLDGTEDIVFLPLFSVRVLLGNGDGTFDGKNKVSPAKNHNGQLAIADFDRDGLPDVVVDAINDEMPSVQVLLGNGDGHFVEFAVYHINSTYDFLGGIVGADFNGDGWPDIAVAVPLYSNNISVLINAGGGG